MKLVGISGTIIGAKTSVVVQQVLNEVKNNHPHIEVEMLDLIDYDVQFCDGRNPASYNEDTKKVLEIIHSADFYIFGTPIFQGSLSGPLKNLFDLIHPNDLRHKVIGFIATGGTYQHFLVIENQLKPIAGFFRAFVAPSYVYAHNDHFNRQNDIVDEEVLNRITTLANEVVYMQEALKTNIQIVR